MHRNDQKDVEDLLRIVAPERNDYLQDLIAKYNPTFSVSSDQLHFVLEANPLGFVRFTDRTILRIWLMGWVMWQEMYCWSSFVYFLHLDKKPFVLAEFANIPDQQQSYEIADSLYSKALAFVKSDPIDWSLWPQSVPKPNPQVMNSCGQEDLLIKDFIHHEIAFFLLHELRHIILHLDSFHFANPIEEEIECDRWAVEYLLANSDVYATTSGEDPIKVNSKRAMGVALGASVIAHVQELGLWESGREHPSITDRIKSISMTLNLPVDDHFWIVASSFLLACLRRQHALPSRIDFRSHRNFFDKILHQCTSV